MKHRLWLDLADANGSTLRQQLLQVAEQTGREPAELEPPKGFEEGDYLLEIFWDVNITSPDNRITAGSLLDWMRLNQLELLPWEIDVIFRCEATLQAEIEERRRKELRKSQK